MHLLQETFGKAGNYKHEKTRLREILYTKAWIIHLWIMFWRVLFAPLGISYWQKSYVNYQENLKLDAERVA